MEMEVLINILRIEYLINKFSQYSLEAKINGGSPVLWN